MGIIDDKPYFNGGGFTFQVSMSMVGATDECQSGAMSRTKLPNRCSERAPKNFTAWERELGSSRRQARGQSGVRRGCQDRGHVKRRRTRARWWGRGDDKEGATERSTTPPKPAGSPSPPRTSIPAP